MNRKSADTPKYVFLKSACAFATIPVCMMLAGCGDSESATGASFGGNSFTDSRDGLTYRTVTIGDQTWMAENLNYAMDGSYCYDDDPANCTKYGRLYKYDAAVNACPTGWHLPIKDEWWTLFEHANDAYVDSAKWSLLARGFENWPDAFDAFNFSVLPAGEVSDNYGYKWINETAFFQVKESSCTSCTLVCLGPRCEGTFLPNNRHQTDGFSVRCLKDDEPLPFTPPTEEGVLTEDGILKDKRDGKNYKTVKIGDQVWMAENLNFETDSSSCYNDSLKYCAKYGRLYNWFAAMDACPSGWHLPDASEFRTLYSAVGNSPFAMQAKGYAKWSSATDAYGFSALPAGGYGCSMHYDDIVYSYSCQFDEAGSLAVFWSTFEDLNDACGLWILEADKATFRPGDIYSTGDNMFSVRCLKD